MRNLRIAPVLGSRLAIGHNDNFFFLSNVGVRSFFFFVTRQFSTYMYLLKRTREIF